MRTFSTIYLILLLYIVAALVFWGISLHKQSNIIFEQQKISLHEHIDPVKEPLHFQKHLDEIEQRRRSRTAQYIGEGATFLFVILIGAAVVYVSFKRNLKLSKQQTNFMLSVTHELKSPLAGIKLNLQTLQKHKLDSEKQELLINRCIAEANRLNDLCNNMLLASQMESSQYYTSFEALDFEQLVQNSVAEFCNRYGKRFVLDNHNTNAQHLNVMGDHLLLQMLISNLLENAQKYAPKDTEILVQLIPESSSVLLRIADQGNGIPNEEKKNIFKKFYRVGNEDTRKTKGTGLGLFITQVIVKKHLGKITVLDNKPKGAIFEVSLPLEQIS